MSGLRTAVLLARPAHWLKNVLLLPSIGLAVKFTHTGLSHLLWPLFIGLCSLCLITSANYVINEWLDASTDRFHPTKKKRPLVIGKTTPVFIYSEYAILSASGLSLAAWLSPDYLFWSFLFWILGILYNVKPIRTKDLPHFDILSEGLDNPIRLVLGWTLVAQGIGPPLTLSLGYWMASAFQGTVRRLGELRFIGDRSIAEAYRRSFRTYTETSLLLLSALYATGTVLFFSVFLISYRIEFMVLLPFLAILFIWYLAIGLKENSAAQDLVELFRRERLFIVYALIGLVVFIALTFVDLSWLRTSQQFSAKDSPPKEAFPYVQIRRD